MQNIDGIKEMLAWGRITWVKTMRMRECQSRMLIMVYHDETKVAFVRSDVAAMSKRHFSPLINTKYRVLKH